MAEGLSFRQDYLVDPAAFEALAALLQDTFGIDIRPALTLAGMDRTTVPFGYFDEDGRCVANFSMFSMPLMVDGERVMAAGYQSGAVRPEHRGNGLYRDLMRRAFAHARATGHAADILITDKPGLYEPYGFRQVRTFGFRGKAPAAQPGAVPGRGVSPENADDVALMVGLLARREPVSQRFSVMDMRELFLLNALWQKDDTRLTHLPAHDAVVAWKRDGARLELLDIIAPSIPPLAAICAGLGGGFAEVESRFGPDQLDWPGAEAIADNHLHLMASGPLADRLNAGPVGFTTLSDF
ncbi:GNAT family N-acetyltransferase [Martelella limonii]|uniref:GNAT family N-acetyltransferase n=1 Tax=Martelella limonii TaxID=1647649 RepID=UPI001580A3DB|nr:GNAT family N-acetyltransferase [Martelella limonii]